MTETERDETPEGFRVESLGGVQVVYYDRPILDAATLAGVRRRALAGPEGPVILDLGAPRSAAPGAFAMLAALCRELKAAGRPVAAAMPMGPLYRQAKGDPASRTAPFTLLAPELRHRLGLERLPDGYSYPPDTEPWFTDEEMAEAASSGITAESILAELDAQHGPA